MARIAYRSVLSLATATLTIALWPATASAQTAESSDIEGLLEVVVTARKRNESLLNVPLSVSAVTAESIAERNIKDIRDLAAFTPGLSYTAAFGRANGERPVIRGQSNILGRPNAAFFVDGIYITGASVTTELSSLERVEVLKGPQAAQYGRGTFAGAINYITKKPSDTFGGSASLSYGEHEEINVSAMVTGPLITDRLAFLLSASSYEYAGEYDNAITGQRLGDESTSGAMLKLRWTPLDNLSVDWLVSYSKSEDGSFLLGFQTRDFNNCEPRTAAAPRSREYRCGEAVDVSQLIFAQRSDLLPRGGGLDDVRTRTGLNVKWGFGGGYEFGFNAGYNDEAYKFSSDVSYAGYDAFRGLDPAVIPAIPVSPVGDIVRQYLNAGSFWRESWEQRKDSSYELRIASPSEKRLRWSAGAYYFRAQDDETQDLKAAPDGTIVPNGTAALTFEKTKNTAFFASLDFDLTDRWTASVEARRAKDEISQLNVAYPAVNIASFTSGMGVVGIPTSVSYQFVSAPAGTFKSTTPRASLRFKPNEDTSYYFTFARGNKPGGFNTGTVVPLLIQEGRNPNYDEELVKSYEAGAKFRLMDGRVNVSVAAYFNDLFNQQLTQNIAGQVGTTPVIGSFIDNVGETTIRGLEFEINARINSRWDATIGYALAKAEIEEFVTQDVADLYSPRPAAVFAAFSPMNPTGCFPTAPPAGQLACQQLRDLDNAEYGDVAGNVPPRAPKHQGFITSRYSFPLEGGRDIFVAGDYTYESSKFAQVDNLLETGDRVALNARIGIETDRWSVMLWAKNLTDDDTALDVLRYIDTRAPIPAGFSVLNSPRGFAISPPRQRQFGLTGSIRF